MNGNTSEPMSAADIQDRLRAKGVTQKKLAERWGVTEFVLGRVIRTADGERKCVSDKLMKKISRFIGVSHKIAFADYYGKPRPKRGRKPITHN